MARLSLETWLATLAGGAAGWGAGSDEPSQFNPLLAACGLGEMCDIVTSILMNRLNLSWLRVPYHLMKQQSSRDEDGAAADGIASASGASSTFAVAGSALQSAVCLSTLSLRRHVCAASSARLASLAARSAR